MSTGTLSNIESNYKSSIGTLKREWRSISAVWTDAKAAEFKKTYLLPIVQKQNSIQTEMKNLQKAAKRLSELGVNL